MHALYYAIEKEITKIDNILKMLLIVGKRPKYREKSLYVFSVKSCKFSQYYTYGYRKCLRWQ